MTTSGSSNFELTTNTIIEEALDICGIGQAGEAITADMLARGKRSLNLIVKARGASEHLWLKTEGELTLQPSTGEYDLTAEFGVKPMRVLSVRRRLTNGCIDTPLNEISRQEYFDTSSKCTESVPVSFYYDPQLTIGTLYLWPYPSSETASQYTLCITYLRKVMDFDNSYDEADLPQEWLQALTYALAEQLALKYGIDDGLRREIATRAKLYFDRIDSWDVEPASLFMQPDGGWQDGWR